MVFYKNGTNLLGLIKLHHFKVVKDYCILQDISGTHFRFKTTI